MNTPIYIESQSMMKLYKDDLILMIGDEYEVYPNIQTHMGFIDDHSELNCSVFSHECILHRAPILYHSSIHFYLSHHSFDDHKITNAIPTIGESPLI